MAFIKTAKAKVIHPAITGHDWGKLRSKVVPGTFGSRIAKVVSSEFSPDQYLLSHATIVASVDVQDGTGKLGRSLEGGFELDRKYQDYLVTPETAQFVNNNGDCWSRQCLLNTYKTFIGGQNFVEHLQIPEMSKGTIVDAVARDIGPSVYVDILVATARKHTQLIEAINGGQVNAMSMGCTVAYCICTQCGNVAVDETQMCSHSRYMKRQFFVDAQGQKRIIAELCGHASDPDSVKFIEASWVANPAFTGAVLRSILSDEEARTLDNRIQVAFSLPKQEMDLSHFLKAARALKGFGFDQGGQESAQQAPAAPSEPVDPVADAVRKLEDHVRTKVLDEINNRIDPKPAHIPDPAAGENTLVKQASRSPYWRRVARQIGSTVKNPAQARKTFQGVLLQRHHGWNALRTANYTKNEVLAVSRYVDLVNQGSRAGDLDLYRTLIAVGGLNAYPDSAGFLAACRRVLGRNLSQGDIDTLVSKGRLYDLGV